MKRKKMLRIAAGILCLMSFLAAPVTMAYANSAQKWFSGSNAHGTVLLEESPIVVEHETLTFDIDSFPNSWGGNEEYDATVTAEV